MSKDNVIQFKGRRKQLSDGVPGGEESDLNQRLERIRSSITRINQLMSELRSMRRCEGSEGRKLEAVEDE